MNEPYPSRKHTDKSRSLLERFTDLISPEPDSRQELLETLQDAHDRNLISADSLSMIEGVFQVSEMCVQDIMIPRAQMDMIDIDKAINHPDQLLSFIIEKAHSRYPVFEDKRDNVIGILLAKDFLSYTADKSFNVREKLRPVVVVPESKRLNTMLNDFRLKRNHIAIVLNEYGEVTGLVTIEDVLEQIVGDIDDEHDFDEEKDNIILLPNDCYRVHGNTPIDQFNEVCRAEFDPKECETIGDLVIKHFDNTVPHREDIVTIADFNFEVLRSDAREVHVLKVCPIQEEDLTANIDEPSIE